MRPIKSSHQKMKERKQNSKLPIVHPMEHRVARSLPYHTRKKDIDHSSNQLLLQKDQKQSPHINHRLSCDQIF